METHEFVYSLRYFTPCYPYHIHYVISFPDILTIFTSLFHSLISLPHSCCDASTIIHLQSRSLSTHATVVQVVARWPVEHACKSCQRPAFESCVKRRPDLKSLRPQYQPPSASSHFLSSVSQQTVLEASVRVTQKKHTDSCKPAWLEMD